MALFQHTLGILFHPDTEWKAIRNERNSFKQIFLSHVPFLALIPVVAAFYGVTQVGWTAGASELPTRMTVESALSLCGLTYVSLLVSVFILGEFINWMAKTYGVKDPSEQRHYEGTALAVYVMTPMFLVGVLLVVPSIWLNGAALMLAGIYSVYLLYEGIPIIMNIDKDRGFMYASSVLSVGLVLMVSVIIATVIIWGLGIGPVYAD